MNKIYKIYLMPFISRKRKQKDVEDNQRICSKIYRIFSPILRKLILKSSKRVKGRKKRVKRFPHIKIIN